MGAPHVVIKEKSRLFTATGLDTTTYVYPSQLVTTTRSELHTYRGRLMDELTELRDTQLRRAVGYGTGCYGGKGVARASLRGVIMELNDWGKEENHSDHALVVAEPFYSTQHEFLNVLPLFPASDYEQIWPDLVFPESAPWVRQLGIGDVLVGVRFAWGLHYEDHILRNRAQPIPEASMEHVDSAMKEWFEGLAW